jgi:hypothetical protein
MKKIWNILWGISISPIILFASTRGDVKIIEASENIRYLGQKISKEYLSFYHNPRNIEIKERLYEDIKRLEQSIIDIATITHNKDSKDILDFLTYNKNDVKKLVDSKSVDREKAVLMLNYSEGFLESANFIENAHKYDFSLEEKMLMSLKDIEYLLEKISKYYIAYTLNIDKNSNFENMNRAVTKVEDILKGINSYNYPQNLFVEIKKMNNSWTRHKKFLYKVKQVAIPNLMLISINTFEKSIKKIALYHKQNQ